MPSDADLTSGLQRVVVPSLEVVARERNVYTSTYESEIVRCRLADGRELELFCKYGHMRELPPGHSSWGARSGLAYEALVYEHVLEPSSRPTPRLYGSYQPEATNEIWLVLQFVDLYGRVSKQDLPGMVLAARWLGEFHREQAQRLHSPDGFLTAYDEAYYRGWLERALEFQPSRPDWLTALADGFGRCVQLLEPDTVVHGEYYPQNVLVEDGLVYPVDWESAALGPGDSIWRR